MQTGFNILKSLIKLDSGTVYHAKAMLHPGISPHQPYLPEGSEKPSQRARSIKRKGEQSGTTAATRNRKILIQVWSIAS
jgi:hypothetical protein